MTTTTTTIAKSFEVRLTAHKGYGVFATRNIEAGTVILTDSRIMCIESRWSDKADAVMRAFRNLSPLVKEGFLKLHACPSKRKCATRIDKIYNTNSFTDDRTSYICLTISRTNHACTPNALSQAGGGNEDLVRAACSIAAEEEITISYRQDICWLMTRRQRQHLLTSWGFTCKCSSCDRSTHDIELSDARRKIIWGLYWHTRFSTKVDYSHFNRQNIRRIEAAFDRVREPASRFMPDIQKEMVCHLLLAYCLEVECQEKDMIADAYHNAAAAQLAILEREDHNMTILQHALNVRDWMLKAIRYFADYHGKESTYVAKCEEKWRAYQRVPQLKLALHIVDLKRVGALPTRPFAVKEVVSAGHSGMVLADTTPAAGSPQAPQAFALSFVFSSGGKASIKAIGEHECRETVRKQWMSYKACTSATKAVKSVMQDYTLAIKARERKLGELIAKLNRLMMEDLPGYYE